MAYLYLVEHTASGRCYVGWTSKSPEVRWAAHINYARSVRKTYFHKAIHHYGREAFAWTSVQHFDSDHEAMHAEVDWISCMRAFGVDLFNLTDGGDGIPGHRHSDETRAKMRRVMSEETKAKLRAANLGKPSPNKGRRHTDEARARMSAAMKGRPAHNRGTPHSEETKAKMRRPKSDEHRAKISATLKAKPSRTMLGKRHSEATKEKMRRPKSAEHRKKLSDAQKTNPSRGMLGKRHSPEAIEKMRRAAIARHQKG